MSDPVLSFDQGNFPGEPHWLAGGRRRRTREEIRADVRARHREKSGQDDLTRKDMLPGGRADDAKPAEFDPAQLRAGVRHEMEHTGNPRVAMEIAEDHLREDPRYYARLAEMEGKADASADVARAVADLAKALPEALSAAVGKASGPQVAAPPRKVKKTVVRDKDHRIKHVIEEEME